MSFLLALIAIILSIVALSRQSGTDYRIKILEDKLKDLSAPKNKTSEEKTLKETATAESEAQTQPQPADKTAATLPPQEQKEQESPLPEPRLEPAPSKPVNVAQIFSWIGGVLLVLGALFTFS
ncbi:MAG: hypothetical protein ACI352_01075, partial [Elusimicrobiaceae bacterium]